MAQNNTLGLNYTFPIYNADGTSFNGLELKKSTYESVVMSLGDKITGDVYYRSNTLAVTMQEYVLLDGVKFSLVTPPTVVKEGMVSDNSDLKGMTKYSFTFYHPMYMLGNFPFTDIAVTNSQEKYLSQNKTFSWIGTLTEFIAKLNANLYSTEWLVVLSDSVSQEKQNMLSEVLSFDKNFISDALKKCYDTWEIPFVISQIVEGDYGYSNGKRHLITFGLPTQEIYSVNASGIQTSTPFVFEYGKGVGLKNNSRTPKNNKIVTRISGYGSERNIPYGYPQIIWTGNQSWSYTINNNSSAPNSYPIYDGIVGGQKVRLIKHPFTRKTLMPSIYVDTVNKKVNPNASGYDPTIEIKDYYDAIDDATHAYPNNINPLEPSFEIHQFEDIYPHLTNATINGVTPYDGDYEMLSLNAFKSRLQALKANSNNYNEKEALQAIYNGINDNSESIGGSYTYQYRVLQVSQYQYGTWYHVKYTSANVNFEYIVWDGTQAPQINVIWNDEINDEGEYYQSYFKIQLPRLSFDLYASAAVTEEMEINMRSGACLGCTFPVQVDWEDYKKNFYDANGNFDPVIGTGHPRDGEKYPNSMTTEIEVIVQKDLETFGTIIPNIYQQPQQGDEFVVLGISLPTSYITDAEQELDEAMQEYMLENNVHYYDYPLKFDEYFLATHTGILAQMHNNNIVRFIYAGSAMALYIKQITIKYGESVLPQYDITLTDDVEIVLNKIGQVTDDVSRMRVQVSELQKYYTENVINEIRDKLSRVEDDVCMGRITFQQGLDSIGNVIFHDEIKSPQFETGLYDGRGWRVDNLGNAEFESARVRSYLEVVELLINRLQAQEGDTLFTDNDQIEKVDRVVDSHTQDVSYILSLKEKYDGYITCQQRGNILKGIINTLAAKQADVSEYDDSDAVEEDGVNTYYTSWMRVVETPTMSGSTLGTNQIRVVLYSDNETPAGRNFKPCELMTIARWGCVDYSNVTDPDYNEIIASIKRRQRMFMISTSEGRVVKYTDVDSPILQNYNYGVTIGELPEFVKNYPDVSRVLAQVGEHTDWLYAQGIVVGNFIKINREGTPEVEIVDCGQWVNGSSLQNPTPRNGVYLYNEWNSETQQFETHDVWHNGARWRCLQHQPVTIGGVSTYYEPMENSDYWLKLEGGSGVMYRLKPSMSSLPFSVDANNEYTPSSISITCGCTKTDASGTTNITNASSQAIDDTYDIYFRELNADGTYSSDTNHPYGWYLLRTSASGAPRTITPTKGGIDFGLGLKNVWPTPSDAQMFEIQRIPVIKTGKNGQNGQNGQNGSDGVVYYIKTTKDGVVIPPNEMSTSVNITTQFFKHQGDGNDISFMGYFAIYTRTGSTYTLLHNGNDDGYVINTTINACDAISIFMFPSSYNGSSPDSQNYRAKKEILVLDSVNTTNPNIFLRTVFDNGIDFVKEAWEGNWTWTKIDTSPNTVTDGRVCVLIADDDPDYAHDFRQNVITRLKNDTWYTVSFNYYSNGTFNTFVYTNNDTGVSAIDRDAGIYVDGEFRAYPNPSCTITWPAQYDGSRHSFTFKTAATFPTEYVLIMFRCLAGNTTSVCMPKLELGKRATNYLPHESDLVGEKGDGAAIAFCTPASIVVPCTSSITGQVYSSVSKGVTLSLKVGNETATVTGFTWATPPTGVTVQGTYTANCSVTISTSATAVGMASGVAFTVTGTYDGKTYSAPVTLALIGAKQGEDGEGERGKMGRSYYYANDWNASDTTNLYSATDAQAPFFRYNDSYWVYINEDNFTNKSMSWIDSTYGEPSSSNSNWEIMTDDFKYLITEAIFGNYAHFGANIINGDYRFSQYGYMRGFYEITTPINDSTQYQNIDPNDPFGEGEILANVDRKVINQVVSDISGQFDTRNQGHYLQIGSMVEFAASTDPASSGIHGIYRSGDSYFRYRTNMNYDTAWSSWLPISSSTYSWTASSSNSSGTTIPSDASWDTHPPTLTESKPYLWLKTGTNTAQRVSSIIPQVRLVKGKYYTLDVKYEYDDVELYNLRVGNQSSYVTINSSYALKASEKYQLGSSAALHTYALFKNNTTMDNASVWINGNAHVLDVVLYEAQFVPYICEDLLQGKLIANNIVARGELHADSLWYDLGIPNHVPDEWLDDGKNVFYVKDQPIVVLPKDSNPFQVMLPNPSDAKNRIIEIYNANASFGFWWSSGAYNTPIKNILTGNNYKTLTDNWGETYVKLWSDGEDWYVLKTEIPRWEDGRCYIILGNLPSS